MLFDQARAVAAQRLGQAGCRRDREHAWEADNHEVAIAARVDGELADLGREIGAQFVREVLAERVDRGQHVLGGSVPSTA